MNSPASPAPEVRELVKTFGGRRVVNGLSFELQRGEIFGFLGPNGSGKTTTMRMALDLIRPDSGSIALLGGMPTRRPLRRVGYLPEERGLFQRARVLEVLRYLGRLKGQEANAAGRRAKETLERVGLADSARAPVQGLSRGMTHLFQFSGALLHQPDLIILDEPFSGLDLFIVPADFLESDDVEWLSQRSSIFAGDDNRDRFASFLTVSLIAERLDPGLLDRVIAGADYMRVLVGEDGSVSPDDDKFSQFVVPIIFTVLLMMSISMGSGALLQSVSEEKENRMVDVLLTSVSPLSLMAGKILALGTTSLVQIIAWITSIAIIGPQIVDQIPNAAELEIEPLTLIYVSLFFIAGYFLFSVILAGIGCATTSAKEAGSIVAIVVIPAGIPVWLSSVILSAPEGGVARVLSFIPITAPTTMMQRIGSVDVSNAEILASLAVTALGGLVMLFVSARIFRARLLVYGQRMTLGAVWRAVRQAG